VQLSASYLQLYKSGQVSEGSVGDGSEAVPVKQTEKNKTAMVKNKHCLMDHYDWISRDKL